jgi:putative polyketide hydroxylase
VIDDAAIDLGYRYGHTDGTAHCEDPHSPSAAPGFRAPHATAGEGSTLDLIKRDFVLFTGSPSWEREAGEAAQRLGIGLDVHRLGEAAAAVYRLGPDDAVLIRPDGFIAWRTGESGTLREALTRALCRG